MRHTQAAAGLDRVIADLRHMDFLQVSHRPELIEVLVTHDRIGGIEVQEMIAMGTRMKDSTTMSTGKCFH